MSADIRKIPIAERNLAGFGAPRPDQDYGPDEWLRRLGELPLMAQPGELWLYTARRTCWAYFSGGRRSAHAKINCNASRMRDLV